MTKYARQEKKGGFPDGTQSKYIRVDGEIQAVAD